MEIVPVAAGVASAVNSGLELIEKAKPLYNAGKTVLKMFRRKKRKNKQKAAPAPRRARAPKSKSAGVNSSFAGPKNVAGSTPFSRGAVKGTRFVQRAKLVDLSLEADAAIGEVLYSTSLNPSAFTGTPAVTEARLWERYKLVNIKFDYKSYLATTTNGGISMFIDPDADDSGAYPVGALVDMPDASNYDAFAEKKVYENFSVSLKGDPKMTDLYVSPQSGENDDNRWSSPGYFVVCASSNLDQSALNNGALGSIYVDMVYEFTHRTLALAAGTFYSGVWGVTAINSQPFAAAVLTRESTKNDLDISFTNTTLTLSGCTPGVPYLLEVEWYGQTVETDRYEFTVSSGTSVSVAGNFTDESEAYRLCALSDQDGVLAIARSANAACTTYATSVEVLAVQLPDYYPTPSALMRKTLPSKPGRRRKWRLKSNLTPRLSTMTLTCDESKTPAEIAKRTSWKL